MTMLSSCCSAQFLGHAAVSFRHELTSTDDFRLGSVSTSDKPGLRSLHVETCSRTRTKKILGDGEELFSFNRKRGNLGGKLVSNRGLCQCSKGSHTAWKIEATNRKASYGSSEAAVAGNIENSGVVLDGNGGSRAAKGLVVGGAGDSGVAYDDFRDAGDVDIGHEFSPGGPASGEYVADETEDPNLLSEGDYWGEEKGGDEARRAENDGFTSPTTGIEGTTEDMQHEDNERFRLRNGREVFMERAYLVGIDRKGAGVRALFGIKDSLEELAQLADTAGLAVVGSTYQKLEAPNPKTYIGGGKVAELKAAIRAFKLETVIFDDELSPGQARNLEKAFGDSVRVCDRTALILDIFSQRAATREATLQVELAQFEYELPRLTKLWSHLERQAGGMVKGMGEKQIEVDKRILRIRMAALKKDLESVRGHRQQYRDRRAAVPIPVISLVGYTNAGKSTFLNRLSGANVLAEDRLFATLDPTTRRVELPNGKECLFTDTVGFIQKLPTQLVAAFRATLEEISDSSLVLHMVDISHPMAAQQIHAVESVLGELEVSHIPMLTVWNKIDKAEEPERLRAEAAEREDVVCISALTGEGVDKFYDVVEQRIKDLMVWVEAVVPYGQGDIINVIHRLGIVENEEYTDEGTLIRAHVPLALSRQLLPLRQSSL